MSFRFRFAFAALFFLAVSAAPIHATRILLCGETSMEPVSALLDQVQLPYETHSPEELTRLDPGQGGALFLAYDVEVDSTLISWIDAFFEAHGKLFTFYALPSSLQQRLGIHQEDYLRPPPGTLAQIRLREEAVPFLPPLMRQNSWNIYLASPAGDSVSVIGTWADAQGRDTGHPALLLSPRGAHLTHVLLGHDLGGATRLYVALLGHFFPDLWDEAVRGALSTADQVGGSPEDLAEKAAWSKKARKSLERASKAEREAREAAAAGAYGQALDEAFRARDLRTQALAQVQPSRQGEFRAVWLHSPYGVSDWGWDETCRILAENGFNAIVANMLDAGRASYPSEVLPVDPRVEERGDQLRAAVEAAHRYGLAFHAWKVDYNLYSADSAFVAELRRQGRLQKNPKGEEIEWLCPSHPDNFDLEVASLLEVVRNYPVDGIHFDYIRYPGSEGCYCDGCRRRFEEQTGHAVASWPEDVLTGELTEVYQRWRREQITRLVRTVSVQARRIRPEIEISAAVFSNWPETRISIGQDWVQWIEEGYLDFVCPMDYIPDMARFQKIVSQQIDWVAGRVPLYIGIGAFSLPKVDDLIEQIAWTRRAGADGFILFQYGPHLGQEVLPLLHEGVSRKKTSPPHRAPFLLFDTGEGAFEDPDSKAVFYAADQPLPLHVQMVESLMARAPRARITLRTLDDSLIQNLGRLDVRARSRIDAKLVLEPGDYRMVAQGEYRDARGKRQSFVRRGPVLKVRSADFLDSLAQAYGPPQLPEGGLPVGILENGYGGSALLEMLKEVPGLAPFPVRRLSPDLLEVVQVLIVPQPRQRSAFGRAARLALREWVEQGGRLLVTHDMAGIRGLLSVIPEVCRRGTGFPRSTSWQVVASHPAVEGVPPGLHSHSYYDHITLEPGPEGEVLARDDADRPVLVVGRFGQGRYAALGLIPGLAPDDQEVMPEGAERRLVESLVQWLSEDL